MALCALSNRFCHINDRIEKKKISTTGSQQFQNPHRKICNNTVVNPFNLSYIPSTVHEWVQNCCNYESFSQSVVRDFSRLGPRASESLNLVILMSNLNYVVAYLNKVNVQRNNVNFNFI